MERIYLRADLHLVIKNKTVPVGAITELVEGDVYHWGSPMAAALFGSLPAVILYSFFVEHYVSSLTGAVKKKPSTEAADARSAPGRYLSLCACARRAVDGKDKFRQADRRGLRPKQPPRQADRVFIAVASFAHFLTKEVIAAPCRLLCLA